jgi:DNA-binding XRE family transcriptional regulator
MSTPEPDVVIERLTQQELEDFKEWRKVRRRLYRSTQWGQEGGPAYVFDAEQFKAARHKLGLSRREAAEILEVHRNTIMLWEQGSFVPHPKHRRAAILLIAQAEEIK